jgi:phytoene dehydrogenase-like protein
MSKPDVVIVGAGLAGLACARVLTKANIACAVLEASDDVGGRVRSDVVDGFILDRGFQILLTAYPEAIEMLDYDALDLRRFQPGALVHVDGRIDYVADPLRAPRALLSTVRAPIGTWLDRVRVAQTTLQARTGDARDLLRRPDRSTLAELQRIGFSPRIIETFFRPLFSGIQLDPDLEVSSRRFWIIWRMLATGDAAVPATGMGAIPRQLADTLPPSTVQLNARVSEVRDSSVVLASGERIDARAVVVATEGPEASRLLGLPTVASRQVSALWFAAPEPPFREPVLLLDGTSRGPMRNLAVMSNVASTYAPRDQSLIVAAIPEGRSDRDTCASETELLNATRAQLRELFGTQADRWTHLHTHRIRHAQPDQPAPLHPRQRVRLHEGLYVCGDHRDTGSIQGALYSGRRTAELVLRDFAHAEPRA